MRIVSKNSSLERIFSSDKQGIYSDDYYSVISNEIKQTISNAEKVLAVANNDNISDKDFINALKTVSVISEFTEEDCYTILRLLYSDRYNKYFNGHKKIVTNMKVILDGEFYDEERSCGVDLEVLYDENTILNDRHRYTMDELTELVKNGNIIVIREYFDMEPKDMHERDDNYFWFIRKYNCNKEVKNDFTYEMFFSERKEIFPYTAKYVRNLTGRKELKRLTHGYLKNTRDYIEKVMTAEKNKEHKEIMDLHRLLQKMGSRC